MNKISFEDLLTESFEEENNDNYQYQDQQQDQSSLVDIVDHDILMHREIHFNGSFENMVKYYESKGLGCEDDFSLESIKSLAQTEKDHKINIKEALLNEGDCQDIEKFRSLYKKLLSANSGIAQMIANLVLSEDEERPLEIEALASSGETTLKWLIRLIEEEDFYSELSPGYGLAPLYATECLGQIASPKSIPAIFEAADKNMEGAITALMKIGLPACQFLLKIIEHKTTDNDFNKAALILSNFPNDKAIAQKSFLAASKIDPAKDSLALFYLSLCWGELDHKYSSEAKQILKKVNEDDFFYQHIQDSLKLLK